MSTTRKCALFVLVAFMASSQMGAGCKKHSSSGGGTTLPPSSFLTFGVQPSNVNINAVIAPAITVQIRDGSGTLVATATNTVTLFIQTNPGGATLGGTVVRAAVAGVATFDDITLDAAASGYVLRATATGYTAATSTAFNVFAVGPQAVVITTEPPSSVAPHEAFTVVAEIRDASNAVDTTFNGPVTIAFGAQPAGDLLLHASGIIGGDPILELVETAGPSVVATITPTVDLGEVFGMVFDPTIGLVRGTNLLNEFWLLDPSTGDCTIYGGQFSTTEYFKGIAFNGQGQIRALSPYTDTVNTIDLITGIDSSLGTVLTLSGFTVAGCTGLARHPTTGVFYAVLNESTGGFNGRPLVTVNMGTGICTLVGDTGEGIAGLAFSPSGTLYGVSGDGGFSPETLYTIDTNNGSITTLLALGNGDDGESITYVPRRLGGTLTVNAVNGVATFDGLSIDQLGSGYTLIVTSGGLTPDTSAAVNVAGAVSPTATVEFSSAASSVAENVGGGVATVTVQLSGPEAHDIPVMIFIDSASSTATAPDDHTQPLAFQVIIPAGQTSVDINIPIVNDGVAESDEDIVLVIMSAFLSGGPGGNLTHTLTITNDD